MGSERGREKTHVLEGTQLSWTGIRGWIDTVHAIQRTLRPSHAAQSRARKLYRALSDEDIRACPDEGSIQELDALLRASRYSDSPLRWGLMRAFTRAELGTLIVETTNRRRQLEAGSPRRPKGPRLDPCRLPDERLDALIQTHPDLDIVDRLRMEKARRMTAAAGDPSGRDLRAGG